ncbi:NAD(P)-binding protein [Calocera cornea HHB12733]|uniref:NAD(P)-binding protein n=1 Tax=Calocera cornea HHB12733 TaxID=1353952 RepID=A0A165F5Z4_9BASI|nr:NAD(P)-binding protein [Calocera cornea HHB12733]
MKVVITGASGVVGRALVQAALAHTQHTLLLVDLLPPAEPLTDPRVSYTTADLLDYDVFLRLLQGAGGLVHLAGFANPRLASPARVCNTNTSLSYNALCAAAEAGVSKVVLASSVNAIGGAWSPGEPQYVYFPVDELHPSTPSDAYSLSKQLLEQQAHSVARAHPWMSITSLRLHAVLPRGQGLHIANAERARKDLWGWTDPAEAARACLLGLEVGWKGSEAVFVVMPTHRAGEEDAQEMRERFWPAVEVRTGSGRLEKEQGFYDCGKAERVLGWKAEGGKMPGGVEGAS